MIQRSPSRRSTQGLKRAPSSYEIARRREEIQSTWSSDERRRRAPAKKVEHKNENREAQIQAQLRFIEFLIAHNATQPQPSVKRRRQAS